MMAENTTGRNNWRLEEYDRTRPSVCCGMTHIFHGPQMKIDVEKNGLVSVVSRKEIEKKIEVFLSPPLCRTVVRGDIFRR
ncbi:hypothetical protein TNCT_659461 [Trichonephila clavata]|uniref:Uncharacterized protein n=1 Tax=Trichonephila clavata TaxID=2740835 RepID=A0A8X6K6V8_TRICU|nr:hypothetical protein TNCT_659461 [Trichonephila clavata]